MDLEKAQLSTVIRFGTLDQFKYKLESENKIISDVMNDIDEKGISFLGRAIISRKFDIANYLLENGVMINQVSYEGNELHLLAANINFAGAVDIARVLIDRGIDLNYQDKKYGNTAFLTICLEILKHRTDMGMKLIKDILEKNPDVDIYNKSGVNARSELIERGNEDILQVLEKLLS